MIFRNAYLLGVMIISVAHTRQKNIGTKQDLHHIPLFRDFALNSG